MQALTTDEVSQKIIALALPLLEQAGVELVELSVAQYKNEVRACVIADLPTGGISIGLCASLNQRLVEAIDAAGFLPEDGYSLEFSSPGLDRPLVTVEDFNRNLNRAVTVTLSEALDGKKEHSGVLVAVSDGALTLVAKKKKEITISLGQIIKGMLVI